MATNPVLISVLLKIRPQGPNIMSEHVKLNKALNCTMKTHPGKRLHAIRSKSQSQTKTLVLDFSLIPNLNPTRSQNQFLAVQIYVWSQTKV